MANRHLSRSIVLQTLFEWDFRGRGQDPREVLLINIDDFSAELSDRSFIDRLLDSVIDNVDDIDVIISKAAPDWPVNKISVMDRNILRIGLAELLFSRSNDVPPKVAINEAIELAKTFGADTSSRFINGVLGAVYKEMGEPGKDEPSRRKVKPSYENMVVEQLGGAVIYSFFQDEIYIALVHDIFGHWTLSKGKLVAGEDPEIGTIRKIKEELGINIEIIQHLGDNEYVANDPERVKIRKNVSYFLAKAPYEELQLGPSGGLDDAGWFKLSEILELNIYEDILPIVTKAVNILVNDPTRVKRESDI